MAELRRQSTVTRAQRAELERITRRRNGYLFDPHYVFPRRHVERLETLGLVVVSRQAFEWHVAATDAGRALLLPREHR
jgi:hypothetical protein